MSWQRIRYEQEDDVSDTIENITEKFSFPLIIAVPPDKKHELMKDLNESQTGKFTDSDRFMILNQTEFVKHPEIVPLTTISDEDDFRNWISETAVESDFVAKPINWLPNGGRYSSDEKKRYGILQVASQAIFFGQDLVTGETASKAFVDEMLEKNGSIPIEDISTIQDILTNKVDTKAEGYNGSAGSQQWSSGNRYYVHVDGYIIDIDSPTGRILYKNPAKARALLASRNRIKDPKKKVADPNIICTAAYELLYVLQNTMGCSHCYKYDFNWYSTFDRIDFMVDYFPLFNVIDKHIPKVLHNGGYGYNRDMKASMLKIKTSKIYKEYLVDENTRLVKYLVVLNKRLSKPKFNAVNVKSVIDNKTEELGKNRKYQKKLKEVMTHVNLYLKRHKLNVKKSLTKRK